MAAKKCVKKYLASAPTNSFQLNEAACAADLDFPIAADFVSHPPSLDPQLMLRRIEETMRWRSTRPQERERRLTGKVDIEFVL